MKTIARLDGAIDQLKAHCIEGWITVYLPDNKADLNDVYPEISLEIDGIIKARTRAQYPRTDLANKKGASFGFTLDFPGAELATVPLEKTRFTVSFEDSFVSELKLWGPLELALRLRSLKNQSSSNEYKHFERFAELLALGIGKNSPTQSPIRTVKEKPLCVITYANAANGWFPYFFDYYEKIVGSRAIYVITPVPNEFQNLDLGGIITTEDLVFDDSAKAHMASNLATGLQVYYKWALVCDVDEIVIPDPRLGIDLLAYLETVTDNVLLSTGLDVIEQPGDEPFDFSKSVLEQRNIAIPNSAICKPHLSRAPIKYSVGYHYCNYKLGFDLTKLGLLTLHLKYACRVVRAEVASIVAKTTYSDPIIEVYANASVNNSNHPAFLQAKEKKPCDLDSQEIIDFKKKYMMDLREYDGMWFGPHFVDPILVTVGHLRYAQTDTSSADQSTHNLTIKNGVLR